MSREVRIPARLVEEIVGHCAAAKPNEACGLLAGTDGSIETVFTMSNAASSPVRYALDPKEQFEAYRAIDDQGWQLAGVFHSHTRTQAYPSPTDVRLASEDVPYLIVSLASHPPSLRAFRIVKESWTDDEGAIEELPVIVEP